MRVRSGIIAWSDPGCQSGLGAAIARTTEALAATDNEDADSYYKEVENEEDSRDPGADQELVEGIIDAQLKALREMSEEPCTQTVGGSYN